MTKIRKPYYIAIVLLILTSFIYYKGSLHIPVYQNGDLFIGEWIFRESNRGTIIGNPDFVASFIEVTEDNFIEKYEQQSKHLGYTHTIERVSPYENSNFEIAFLINDTYYIDYDEGFFIMDAENYRTDTILFNEVFYSLVLTLDSEAEIEELKMFLKEESVNNFLDYNMLHLSPKVDFRFNDEEGLKLYVEDLRMGH